MRWGILYASSGSRVCTGFIEIAGKRTLGDHTPQAGPDDVQIAVLGPAEMV